MEDAKKTESGKNTALLVYVLQILTLFSGITAIAAVIINYVKMNDVRGTWVESHFRSQLQVFWWGMVFWPFIIFLGFIGFGILGAIGTDAAALGAVILFGLIILIGAVDIIWIFYRWIKGLFCLKEEKEYS